MFLRTIVAGVPQEQVAELIQPVRPSASLARLSQ